MDNNEENNNSKDIYRPSDYKYQTLITDFFKSEGREIKIKGYNSKTGHYHCHECGVDMGNYPGQLCRKSFCDNFD